MLSDSSRISLQEPAISRSLTSFTVVNSVLEGILVGGSDVVLGGSWGEGAGSKACSS